MSKIIKINRETINRLEYREINNFISLGFIANLKNENGFVSFEVCEVMPNVEISQEQNDLMIKIGIFKHGHSLEIYKKEQNFKNDLKLKTLPKVGLTISDYAKYDYDIGIMKENFKYHTATFLRKYLLKLAEEMNLEECYKTFQDALLKSIKLSLLPKVIKEKSEKYFSWVVNEINDLFHYIKLENGNQIKVIDKIDFETLTKNIVYEYHNAVELNDISEFNPNHDYIVLTSNWFSFNTKIKKEDIYKVLMKLNFEEEQIIDDIQKVNKYMKEKLNDESLTFRSIESNLFRYEYLTSLGYGKYKVTIGDNEIIENNKVILANEVKDLLDEYFSDDHKHIVDMVYIARKIKKSKFDFFNEHELYYIAKKYINDFSEIYWSYRPPLVFRASQKESEKNVTKILANHIKEFILRKGIENTWIEKEEFYHILFKDCGMKELNFSQKINDLEKYGINIFLQDGNRYLKGQIKISI